MTLQDFYKLAKKSVVAWIDDYAPSMGAAISYYTVFSIAPLLIIVIAVAGFVWGRDAVEGQLVAQLSDLLGKQGAEGIQTLVQSASKPAEGIIATLISIGVLVVGATTVFAELQSALDRIWNVPAAKKASGIWSTLRSRLLSLGFILGLGFLMSVTLVISAGVAAFGAWANGLFPGWQLLLESANLVISLGVATLLFAMIFKLMPQARIGWSDVWTGAAVTAVLFELGKWLIGLYIGRSSVTSSFAAAGSLVILLIWVYYSAQIFLLGAEFTWAYAHDHGTLSRPGQDVAATAGERSGPTAEHAAALATRSPPPGAEADRTLADAKKDAQSDAPHRSQSAPRSEADICAWSTPLRSPATLPAASLAGSAPAARMRPAREGRATLSQRAISLAAGALLKTLLVALVARYTARARKLARAQKMARHAPKRESPPTGMR
jgi:membrane protein